MRSSLAETSISASKNDCFAPRGFNIHTRVDDLNVHTHVRIPALGSRNLIPQCSGRAALSKEHHNRNGSSDDRYTHASIEEFFPPYSSALEDPQHENSCRYLAQTECCNSKWLSYPIQFDSSADL